LTTWDLPRRSGDIVFRLEHGEWKVVQIHWSLPKENVDLFGKELTVSLEALERTIERDDRISSRR
jgi:hypothetical protein